MGRTVKHARLGLTLIAAISLAACGYFNTMYNANRSFSEAERAASRGDIATARSAYTRAVDKAARQVSKDSTGRYSDDAMLIMGRSWFALGNFDSAAVVLRRLADRQESTLAVSARAWLGAVSAARNDTAAALVALNAALTSDRLDDYTAGIASLWRARVHFAMNNREAALEDLQASVDSDGRLVAPAAVLGARLAFEARDTAALRTHFNTLFASARGAFFTDSIRSLTETYVGTMTPAAVAGAMSAVHDADWPSMRRDSIALLVVSLLQQSGDTTGAIAEAARIANRSTRPLSDQARVTAARMMLGRTRNAADLADIRNMLLPALANTQARSLVQTLRTIDVLLETAARTGEPLAMFVAAEISRDQLAAPRLARQLFVAYADVARGADWSGKALLAAAALPQPPDSAESIRSRAREMRDNVYIAAVYGEDDNGAFADAEERLARRAASLRTAAVLEAGQRETTVGRAVALIDSVRQAARTDSVRISCGILIDSLAVDGIRADSIRSACMRNDRGRIDVLMKLDTLMLRDTVTTDSLNLRTDSLTMRFDSMRMRLDTLRTRPDTMKARADTISH